MNSIFSRRSIRKYTEEKIPEELILELMRAAMAAPSAGNEQPWHFIHIDDREILSQIAEVHPHGGMLKNADCAIAVCADLDLQVHEGYWIQDCSAATQNILLEAQELGLGAVWLGVYPIEERIKGIGGILNLPGDVILLSLISLGYPGEVKVPSARYNPDRVHRNRW